MGINWKNVMKNQMRGMDPYTAYRKEDQRMREERRKQIEEEQKKREEERQRRIAYHKAQRAETEKDDIEEERE